MKAGVQADGLRAVGVADVKLFIFQPETEGSEAGLGTRTPGEIGPMIVDGKKRRVGVAAQIPARKPRLGKDIHERDRKRYETHCKGRESVGVSVGPVVESGEAQPVGVAP